LWVAAQQGKGGSHRVRRDTKGFPSKQGSGVNTARGVGLSVFTWGGVGSRTAWWDWHSPTKSSEGVVESIGQEAWGRDHGDCGRSFCVTRRRREGGSQGSSGQGCATPERGGFCGGMGVGAYQVSEGWDMGVRMFSPIYVNVCCLFAQGKQQRKF
jgi:hypothetical protein